MWMGWHTLLHLRGRIDHLRMAHACQGVQADAARSGTCADRGRGREQEVSWNEAIGLYELSRLEPRLHLDDALAAELLAAARMGVRAVELATTGTLDGLDQRWWIAD